MDTKASHIIAIGGSAGAYEMIVTILDHLPKEFSCSIVIVLHRNSKYETKIENSLSKRLNRPVLSIKDKFPILPNKIYFAPPGYHTLVEPNYYFSLDISDPIQFSRPSIDVFFESVAEVYGANATAFLLSGANNDGAQGFKKLLEHQSYCIAQSPADATIDTMPQSGINISKEVNVMTNKQVIEYFSQIS
ncbi:chemotaxis protein CheB [Sphingobacterium sp. HJSM2_6]|uniref:chemotaxis protein CheB n=1 Tax=Sphingobacterium sp. HJSM2_6 TaxID=3366264 RepID=UPI003BD3C6C9